MSDFTSLKTTLKKFDPTEDRYISQEFQKYAYDLAVELNDEAHMAIYMRLAKTTPRHLLENARSFVKDSKADKPARLYMWKLKQLRAEHKERLAKRIPEAERKNIKT